MSDSLQSLATGLDPAPRTSLVLCPEYRSQPSGLVIEAFLEHVATTGSPETFASISTKRPPEHGRLGVLAQFYADRSKRADGNLAPCPICSPYDPQYLRGLLIWCEASQAIYAIGTDCGRKLWQNGRLDQAIAQYNQSRTRNAVEDALLERLPYVPAFRLWLADHLEIARAADRLTKGFKKNAPRVYAAVKDAMANDGQLLVNAGDRTAGAGPFRLTGSSFVKHSFGAAARLERLNTERLEHLDFGSDPLECIEAISRIRPIEQTLALKWLRDARSEAEKVFRHLDDCWTFLSAANMQVLTKWSDARSAPFRVAAHVHKGRVKIYVYQGRDDWYDELDGLVAPKPPPPL
jgi:hypothetical protein